MIYQLIMLTKKQKKLSDDAQNNTVVAIRTVGLIMLLVLLVRG